MSIGSKFKKVSIVAAVVAMGLSAFLTHLLGGLGARPVVFAEPPAFVEQFAARFQNSEPFAIDIEPATNCRHIDPSELTELSPEEQLVRNVFFCDESPDLFWQLFSHPEKEQRVKIAAAYAKLNAEFTHNEESGFPEKKQEIWKGSEEHLPAIRNAHFEALISAAENGENSYIPYTIAWMSGQGRKTVDLLAWATEHHPGWWDRRFAVFFVVEFGEDEALAKSVLNSRIHDPDYRIRKDAFDQRVRRFTEMLGIAEDT